VDLEQGDILKVSIISYLGLCATRKAELSPDLPLARKQPPKQRFHEMRIPVPDF
jgi:hypothetical protein